MMSTTVDPSALVRQGIILWVLLAVAAIGPGSAFADPIYFSYITTSADGNGPIAGLEFTLSLDQSQGTFEISAPANGSAADWAIGWLQFKLDGVNLQAPAGWTVMDGTQLKQWGNEEFPNNQWQGFYDPHFEETPISQPGLFMIGPLGSDAALTFTFTSNADLASLLETGIPFQVGFYGGEKPNGGYYTDRLSQTLAVPEPSTELLLGLGLGGVLLLAKKWLV